MIEFGPLEEDLPKRQSFPSRGLVLGLLWGLFTLNLLIQSLLVYKPLSQTTGEAERAFKNLKKALFATCRLIVEGEVKVPYLPIYQPVSRLVAKNTTILCSLLLSSDF